MSVSPNSKFIASTSFDETVRVWTTRDAQCLHVLEGTYSFYTSVNDENNWPSGCLETYTAHHTNPENDINFIWKCHYGQTIKSIDNVSMVVSVSQLSPWILWHFRSLNNFRQWRLPKMLSIFCHEIWKNDIKNFSHLVLWIEGAFILDEITLTLVYNTIHYLPEGDSLKGLPQCTWNFSQSCQARIVYQFWLLRGN